MLPTATHWEMLPDQDLVCTIGLHISPSVHPALLQVSLGCVLLLGMLSVVAHAWSFNALTPFYQLVLACACFQCVSANTAGYLVPDMQCPHTLVPAQ